MLHTSVCNFIEKEMLSQVFSCEFCEILSTPSLQNTSRELFLFYSLFPGLSSFYPLHISLFYQGFLSTALMRSLPRVFKVSIFGVIMVCISRIRTEYGEILLISQYSVRMWENIDQNNSQYGHFSRSDYSMNLLTSVNWQLN